MPILTRIELRRGWRALVPTVLVTAAVTAIVVWSVAAARRTDTAFDRMLEATDAWHVLVNPDQGVFTQLTTDAIARIDGVSDVSRIEALFAIPPGADSLDDLDSFETVFASDGGSGYRFARPIMVAGRMPTAMSEVAVDEAFRRIVGVDVGDTLPVRLVGGDDGARIEALRSAEVEGSITFGEAAAAVGELLRDPTFAPVRDLTVTGVMRPPDGVVVDGGYALPYAQVSPALFDELGRPALLFGAWHVRLDDGARVDELRDAVDALVPEETIVYQTMANVEAKAERATSTPGGVLGIFAVAVLALGVLLVAQSVQRWISGRSDEGRVLRLIGSTHRQRWAMTMLQSAAAVIVGVVAGSVAAYLASPFAPIGVARRVEPRSGLHADWVALGGGALTIAAIVLAGAALPAWWMTGDAGDRRVRVGPGRLARTVDAMGAPLPFGAGIRFALEPAPGRRESGRLAIVGAFTGVVLATAAIVVTASIGRVTSTPRLYGTNFSALLSFEGEGDAVEGDPATLVDGVVATVLADPAVRAASSVHAGELGVEGSRLPFVAMRASTSPVGFTVVKGRVPEGPGEVALGRAT
ncbi:MAG: hypothetical protein MUE78_06870, partial [Ilumatobacteraceae bacterium]|nr:hypothetical protein [Ilumatobacteraceae bacterium]